jgi:hypothetical protein
VVAAAHHPNGMRTRAACGATLPYMTIGGSLMLIALGVGFVIGLVFLTRRPAGPPPV